MELPEWPKVSRYRGRKVGRPTYLPPGARTLPPLPSLEAKIAHINPNGDPAADVLRRARAEIDQLIEARIAHANGKQPKRVTEAVTALENLIREMEARHDR